MFESHEQVENTDTQSSPAPITSKDVFNTDFSKLDQGAVEPTIYELEKLSKFKYQGQELTPKDLESMILRQKDYTQKTQSLSKERESFKAEQKYYENLHYDLENVKNNPQLAQKFIEIYPEKFHSYLKQVLGQNQNPAQSQQNQAQQYDVDLMSRLQKLESYYNDQEVAKHTQAINSTISKLESKYPDADKEKVLGRVWQAAHDGAEINDQLWENTFKTVEGEFKARLNARYGDLVKQQTEANKKARDVETGGGTVGRAPQKFKSLKDVTSHAINDLTKR